MGALILTKLKYEICMSVRRQAPTVARSGKIFLCHQTRQLVSNVKHFGDLLCLHNQGMLVHRSV
jgi:hypothetical protein